MNSRHALAVLILATLGCGPEGGRIGSVTPSPRPADARPAWVKEGIVMAGNWEPLTFIRRRGGQPLADVENWPLERSEEAARKLREAGVNLVITNFHKGFGLKTEAEDIEATRRFTEFAHRHGIRVGGYIGATMMYETFFAEEPRARDWMQVDEWGRPVYYNRDQTFRYAACRNNPGYHAFLRRLLELGVRDVKLDLIHFDQMQFWPEPRSCRCKHCREQFRAFLQARYPAGRRTPRFGFERFDDMAPPPYDIAESASPVNLPALRNPLMQEWALFRMASIKQRFAEYDDLIYSLNPEVALEGNPNVDPATNRAFTHGSDLATLLEHGDIVWNEDHHHAQWTADGRLISKIRAFKSARIMGKSVFVYTGGRYGAQDPASPPHLRLAEAMAFNDMNLGMVGDVTPGGVDLTPEARRYIDFFRAHAADLKETVPAGDVAVLRSLASMEFNPASGIPGAVLFEQTLIQNQIPFDIIFDRHLNGLSRYRVLVLANQDALSEAQAGAIREFVEQGGGLVATGNSSLMTDWLLQRREFGLAEVFGISQPPLPDAPNKPVRKEYGKGRAVYIPRIQPAIAPPQPQMNYSFGNAYWKLPVNAAELAASVVWAAGGSLAARVKAPPHVAVELARQRGTEKLLLHLVNYNFARPVHGLEAAVRIPQGSRVREAVFAAPDQAGRTSIPVTVRDGVAQFRVPRLAVYGLVTLSVEKP